MPKCHRMSLLQAAGPRRSLSFFCLLRRVVGPGDPSKPPHVVVPWDHVGVVVHVRQQCTGLWQATECCASNVTRRARARGQHGGNLEEPASPPRLLTGAARAERMQVSMFILVVLSSAQSQTLVEVLVSPPGNGTSMAKASTAISDQAVVSPSTTVRYPGVLPLQVLALSTSLHRLLLLSCLQTPPPPTLLSPLCSLERNQGDGLIKSHSQPAKPPPCSPGKCSLCTHGQCWGRVGPEQTSAGERAVLSQGCQGKGVGTLSELLERPVLCLHHCTQPYVGPVWVYLPKVRAGTRGWDV